MKWFENSKTGLLLPVFFVSFLVVEALCPAINYAAEAVMPIADARLPRYVAQDPVILDGTASFDPDNSGLLSYTWRQISGPSVVITDADSATPTISGFVQTDEIQECNFELVVSDGELTSLPDTVKVIIVPAYPLDRVPELRNEFFDPDKPTIILFRGGDGTYGAPEGNPYRLATDPLWLSSANIISFRAGYEPDNLAAPRHTYYRCGDMIIVYLSSAAPNYKQAIQTIGHSTGGLPAMDVGLHLNLTYNDRRYAVNRVTLLDVGNLYWRDPGSEDTTINQFLASSVDGEQCWIDDYWWGGLHIFSNILNVQYPVIGHYEVRYWYDASLTDDNKNQFNNGVVAGAYWSVIGPGKNLQLASTGDYTYVFKWPGGLQQAEPIELYEESSYPGRLPEPVTLIGPIDVGDPSGVVLTCEESENAVGYQLLFGPDPYRVMDYEIVSDTPTPPNDVTTALPFEETWWTVRVRDEYGSTIYADPVLISEFHLTWPVQNLRTSKRYTYIQDAIDDAEPGDEIVAKIGVYSENIDFKGKNLTLRSSDPNDPSVVAATVIKGNHQIPVVTFFEGEDESCVLDGFTIAGGNMGVCYCSGGSPTITNCTIAKSESIAMEVLFGGPKPNIFNCVVLGDIVQRQSAGNLATGKRYPGIQQAIDAAESGDEIVVGLGVYNENIDFKGKNLTIRSIDPNDSTVVAAAVINGSNQQPVVTFSGGENALCVLAGFTITGGKRGIFCSQASPTIINCIITGNTTESAGGGISCENNSNPKLTNCTISGNSALIGGAIYSFNSSPILINSILWDDAPDEIFAFGGTPTISYSDVQGGWAGEGNIDADPLFADPDNGDFHLKSQSGRWDPNSQSWARDDVTSPCIDAGDPISPVGSEQLPNGGIINMGAYGGKPEASKSP